MFLVNKAFILGLSATFALVATPLASQAQDSDARDELLACDTLKSPEERLKCFNLILEKLKTGQANRKPANKAKPSSEPKPEDSSSKAENPKNSTTPNQPKNIKPETDDTFGFTKAQINQKNQNKRTQPQSLTATVKRHWRNYAGQYTMVLENGQVWTAASGNYKKLPKKGKITVEIKKGSMGGFRMKINGGKRAYRVKRLK